jgi:hypothetical protein
MMVIYVKGDLLTYYHMLHALTYLAHIWIKTPLVRYVVHNHHMNDLAKCVPINNRHVHMDYGCIPTPIIFMYCVWMKVM